MSMSKSERSLRDGSMDVRATVYDVVAKVFAMPVETIRDDMTPADIDNWDSLAQLSLVLDLEQTFAIAFEPEDAFRIVTVESIIDIVHEKL
jgi:acyl carrier protein